MRPHMCPPPSRPGRRRDGVTDSPAEKSHFHVPPGQHLADAPHFGQVAFDVHNLFLCRNGVQFCIPVGVCRWRLNRGHRSVRGRPSPQPQLPATTSEGQTPCRSTDARAPELGGSVLTSSQLRGLRRGSPARSQTRLSQRRAVATSCDCCKDERTMSIRAPERLLPSRPGVLLTKHSAPYTPGTALITFQTRSHPPSSFTRPTLNRWHRQHGTPCTFTRPSLSHPALCSSRASRQPHPTRMSPSAPCCLRLPWAWLSAQMHCLGALWLTPT